MTKDTTAAVVPATPKSNRKCRFFNCLSDFGDISMSIKTMKVYVIMIAIFQVLVSHLILFVVLLALTHAEQIINVLIVDMADQKEREEYYELTINSKGETLNQVRFNNASILASTTLTFLYICATFASLYLIACIGLLMGVIKHRPELMIPWLTVHLAGSVLLVCLAGVWTQTSGYEMLGDYRCVYWLLVIVVTIFDLSNWHVAYRFYENLNKMVKLTKSATVSIPYPVPGTRPYHYSKENMYIGDGGHKHLLTDDPNPNYVV